MKLRGEWFGLSFAAFLLVAALVAIPAGRMIGSMATNAYLARLSAEAMSPNLTVDADAQPVQTTRAAHAMAAAPAATAAADSRAGSPAVAAPTPEASASATSPAPTTVKAAISAPASVPAAPPVTAAQSAAQPASAGFVIQVAAMAHQQNAESLADALKKKGFPVLVTNPRRDALYHVKVGPYPDERHAETAAQALEAAGFTD